MKIIKYISITLLLGALVVFISCDPKKLDLTNPNEIAPEDFFKNETQVQAAVNSAYGNLQTQALYNRHIWFGYDNMAHENCGNPQLEADKRQYLNFSFDATHGPIGAFWESCYRGINKANFVINNADVIDEIPDEMMSDERKAKFNGEAKFMRALYYFMLVTRFGDVPLMLEVPEGEEGLPRTPAAQIWAQIESDLTDATNQCLDKLREDAGRATRGAAWALLGKAYLFQEKYTEALAAFQNVTGYSLEDIYINNFLEETEHGNESIFEVEFNIAAGNAARWTSDRSDQGLNESCFRGQEYGCFDWFNVFPSLNLRNEFEPNDPRYGFCFYSNGDLYNTNQSVVSISPLVQSDDSEYPRVGWRKYQNYYKQPSEGSVSAQASGINMKIIRYADVLLMMAECQAQLNPGNLTEAIATMNRIRTERTSVQMPEYDTPVMDARGYPVTNLDEFMVALEHERKVELCGEQVRFPDLVRWDRLADFIEELKASGELPLQEQNEILFDPNVHYLWPIPQTEIDVNNSMSASDQNPGY